MQEKNLTEQESLKLITQIIHQARGTINENGTSSILWGTVVGISGLVSFAQLYGHFSIGFDIWLLTLAAIVPQIFISVRERRQRTVLTHTQVALNAVWTVYALSIFALIFYVNVAPHVVAQGALAEGRRVFATNAAGTMEPFEPGVPSASSLFLLLYAIPTLATGLITRFTPFIIGAILCYILFVVSCYTNTTYDMLWSGVAGICNWLIPGLILRRKYLRNKKAANV